MLCNSLIFILFFSLFRDNVTVTRFLSRVFLAEISRVFDIIQRQKNSWRYSTLHLHGRVPSAVTMRASTFLAERTFHGGRCRLVERDEPPLEMTEMTFAFWLIPLAPFTSFTQIDLRAAALFNRVTKYQSKYDEKCEKWRISPLT